jgi:hypothetical protein
VLAQPSTKPIKVPFTLQKNPIYSSKNKKKKVEIMIMDG